MLLRSQVVLLLTGNGTIHHNQLRLLSPGLLHNARHINVLALCKANRFHTIHHLVHIGLDFLLGFRTNPAAIQPEDIHFPVIRHQLIDLPMREIHKLLPLLRILLDVVVHIPVKRRKLIPPVIRTVPVGLGKIRPDPQPFRAESIEHFLCYITARVRREWRCFIGDFIVRIFCIEHAETIMVLGSEHHVFHTGIFGSCGPFFRTELRWIERVPQLLIILPVFVVGIAFAGFTRTGGPAYIFRTNTPAFHNAPLAVGPPVHQQAEFQVFPLLQPLIDSWVRIGIIVFVLRLRCHHQQADRENRK